MEFLIILFLSGLLSALLVWISYKLLHRRAVGYLVVSIINATVLSLWTAFLVWMSLDTGRSSEVVQLSRFIDAWGSIGFTAFIYGVLASFPIYSGVYIWESRGDVLRRAAFGTLGIIFGFCLNAFGLSIGSWLIIVGFGDVIY